MKFSKSELDIIYQYAAPTKAETLAGMKEIVPVIKDILTKAIVENAVRKLERIPEPECSQFIAATKARFLAERDNSIRQRLAAAKLQEPIMQGHDLSGKERFHPENPPLKEGAIIHHLGKWCIAPCRERPADSR